MCVLGVNNGFWAYSVDANSISISFFHDPWTSLFLRRLSPSKKFSKYNHAELHDDLWSQVKECLDDLERLLPEEVSYNFSGYLDSICLEYLHTFSDWIDRVLSQQQKGD